MTTPTDAELAAWEALADAATPAPWAWWRDPGLTEDGVHCPNHPLAKRLETDGVLIDTATVCRGMTGGNREANAQFIAAAREGWPQCIAALRAARAQLAAAEARTLTPTEVSALIGRNDTLAWQDAMLKARRIAELASELSAESVRDGVTYAEHNVGAEAPCYCDACRQHRYRASAERAG